MLNGLWRTPDGRCGCGGGLCSVVACPHCHAYLVALADESWNCTGYYACPPTLEGCGWQGTAQQFPVLLECDQCQGRFPLEPEDEEEHHA